MDTGETAGSVPPPTTKSEPTAPPAQAGWYPDPAGSGGKRYWDSSAWTGQVTPPEPAPDAPPVAKFDPGAAVAEAAATVVTLKQQQRDNGARGTAKRGFGWIVLIVLGLMIVGAVMSIFSGGGASTATSSLVTDPCSQAGVFAAKETVAQYKKACPNWHSLATPTYPTTVPATAPVGTGGAIFGGTQAAWDAAHVPDPNVQADGAFDPSPGSYPDSPDRFSSMNYDNGRVWNLTEALPPNADIKSAVAAVKKMLPADAKLGHVVVLDVCAALGITSATLGSEVGSPNAVAFFDSGTAGDHYDPTDVGEFSLSADETVPSSC
jgi:hypothetical protein